MNQSISHQLSTDHELSLQQPTLAHKHYSTLHTPALTYAQANSHPACVVVVSSCPPPPLHTRSSLLSSHCLCFCSLRLFPHLPQPLFFSSLPQFWLMSSSARLSISSSVFFPFLIFIYYLPPPPPSCSFCTSSPLLLHFSSFFSTFSPPFPLIGSFLLFLQFLSSPSPTSASSTFPSPTYI